MNLIDSAMESCVLLDKVSAPDGLGGFTVEWTDGAEFQAAIVRNTSLEARVAEKQGVTELYTVTVSRDLPIMYHDVFRRESDGGIFRVTSNARDSETPKVATFQFAQVTAERWDLHD